jgi:D-serine deaminase-like pyridoxal phosphate-dependent protein
MNLSILFDLFVNLSENIVDISVDASHWTNLLPWFFQLMISLLVVWIIFKLTLFILYPSSSGISNIYPKLFEDFNRILLSNSGERRQNDENNDSQGSQHLPAALVDLKAFDGNISILRHQMSSHPEITIRIPSKSIRVPSLMHRILSTGPPFKGLMCFTVEEAQFLSTLGFDDFLIAYPTQQILDYQILRDLHDQQNKIVRIIVDQSKAIEDLNQFMTGVSKPFPVILEFDVSLRLLRGRIHIGARRSPIRSIPHLIEMIELVKRLPFLRLEGLIAYESHISGVGDINPINSWLNPIIRWMKIYSISQIQQLRKEMNQLCLKYDLTLFNGGGTGSLLSTLSEGSILTEITVASGFLQAHLFDHYQQNELIKKKYGSTFLPACYFALPIVRISDEGEWVTCLGGGYVASGKPGWDKVPLPVFPLRLKLSNDEGTGEIQTPLRIDSKNKKKTLQLLKQTGLVYFRHAKSGELAERFMTYLLVENGQIVEIAKTYRGFGKCLL